MDDKAQAPNADEQRLEPSAEADLEAAVAVATVPAEKTSLETADGWESDSTLLRVLGESSTNPAICPFLRAIADDELRPPVETPDPANRCAAIGQPTPQSGRQQELVCLTRGHHNCPRYLRGALILGELAAVADVRTGPSVAVVGAAVTLAVAASLSVGFLLLRGGFDLALASPTPGQPAVAAASPGPTMIIQPSSAPTAIPLPTASPTALPTPSPSPIVSPPPTLAPTVTPKPTPPPTSNRYAFLKPCPSTPKCWIYSVRRGDNLRSIVDWFGVPYETVVRMNPQISDPTRINIGDQVRMPPPTR